MSVNFGAIRERLLLGRCWRFTCQPARVGSQPVAEAELTRFIKADFDSDFLSYWLDEEAIKKAERFDGKLALVQH